jgi:hypothetical protein
VFSVPVGSTEEDDPYAHNIDESTEVEDRGTTVAGKMIEAASFQTEGGSDAD